MNTTKEIPHGTNKRTSRVFEDVKINVKIKLSVLWVTMWLIIEPGWILPIDSMRLI